MRNICKPWMALMAVLLMTNCTGSFEDVNTYPDAFEKVPPTNLLAFVLQGSAQTFGEIRSSYDTFGGYIVPIQYFEYMGDLIPSKNEYVWEICYTNNAQLNNLLANTQAEAAYHKNIRCVARIWKNHMWQLLLDSWGDIPYSEALKAEEGILSVKYDKQEDIYPAILKDLKAIADELDEGFGPADVGAGDFIYNGDMEKWQKFCNSLRLRIAMRISAVAPELARQTIEEICTHPSRYPIGENYDDNCYLWWPGTSPNYECWYNDMRGRDDFGMFDILINHLSEMQDPRLKTLANPAKSDGQYRGFQNCPASMPVLNTISRMGTMYREDPAGFTPFLKSCENYFIIAEAAMKGWNVGMSAGEAYETAVILSMKDNGIGADEIETYLNGKGKWNNTTERIWWESWIALFKEGWEAWSLYRRTGIPSTNYPAIKSIYGSAHNDQPFRLPYPQNQYDYNTENLTPALEGIKDYCWGKQLWWDKRTGVY